MMLRTCAGSDRMCPWVRGGAHFPYVRPFPSLFRTSPSYIPSGSPFHSPLAKPSISFDGAPPLGAVPVPFLGIV